MIFFLSHIIIHLFCVVVWHGCLRPSGAIPFVSNAVIELETTTYDGFTFAYSVVGRSLDSDEMSRTARICTETGESQDFVQDNNFWNIPKFHNGSVIVRSLRHSYASGYDTVGANFGSRFSTDFANQWMMIPSHRQLIINPSNPRDFVKDGILSTTRSIIANMLSVVVSVSVLSSTHAAQQQIEIASLPARPSIHVFKISTGQTSDLVPPVIMQEIHDELQRLSIPCYTIFDDDRIVSIDFPRTLTDAEINSLPTIQYRVHTDSGRDAVIRLNGADYILRRPGDLMGLRLMSTTDMKRFGTNTLSKIALFVDYENRTIGFGEPL